MLKIIINVHCFIMASSIGCCFAAFPKDMFIHEIVNRLESVVDIVNLSRTCKYMHVLLMHEYTCDLFIANAIKRHHLIVNHIYTNNSSLYSNDITLHQMYLTSYISTAYTIILTAQGYFMPTEVTRQMDISISSKIITITKKCLILSALRAQNLPSQHQLTKYLFDKPNAEIYDADTPHQTLIELLYDIESRFYHTLHSYQRDMCASDRKKVFRAVKKISRLHGINHAHVLRHLMLFLVISIIQGYKHAEILFVRSIIVYVFQDHKNGKIFYGLSNIVSQLLASRRIFFMFLRELYCGQTILSACVKDTLPRNLFDIITVMIFLTHMTHGFTTFQTCSNNFNMSFIDLRMFPRLKRKINNRITQLY